MGLIVGVVSGFGAAAFFYLLELAKHFTFDILAGYPMPAPAGERLFEASGEHEFRKWFFFLMPAVAGLLSGILVYNLAPEAEGHGTDAMIDSFHNREGRIRSRVPFVKALATIFVLAGGGSGGREGPIAQIGAGFGSWIATVFRLPARDRRILLLAGTGGGLGAIFRAPFGGAITACEVIYSEDLETDALIPTVIASITAYTIFSQLFGFRPIFDIPELDFHDPRQLVFYVILGLVCVPVGVFYIRFSYFLRYRIFVPMNIPNYLKPMIGGLMVGIIGLLYPQVYSGGWGQVQEALLGHFSPEMLATVKILAAIAFCKILATSFTIFSGGSGGVFGPTLFIGGMIGGVVGYLAHHFFPDIVTSTDASSFVLVGMASFFAGVAHAPLGALLMVTEMTGGYELIAPLLLVSVIAIMFNRRWSIYEKQVKNKFNSPAHIGEFTVNVLEDMYVNSVYRPKKKMPTIPANATLSQVQDFLAMEEEEVFPVVKQDGTIPGLISLDTSRPILFEEGVDQFLIAEDLAIPAGHVHPGDSLYQALVEFLKYPISGILVLDSEDESKILGVLHHRDLIRAYNNEIVKRKGP
ncbi:MAG: chloride channel protein [bacterium]